MKVSNLMTSHPISVVPTDSIQQAQDLMDEEDIRQIPVMKDKELVGIISDRDIR